MQIIAREVELQTMRRSAPKNSNENGTKTNKAVQKPKPQNHLQRLNTKSGNVVAKTKDLVRFVIKIIIFFHHFLLEKSRECDDKEKNVKTENKQEIISHNVHSRKNNNNNNNF